MKSSAILAFALMFGTLTAQAQTSAFITCQGAIGNGVAGVLDFDSSNLVRMAPAIKDNILSQTDTKVATIYGYVSDLKSDKAKINVRIVDDQDPSRNLTLEAWLPRDTNSDTVRVSNPTANATIWCKTIKPSGL